MQPGPNDTRLVLIRHGESVAQVEGFLSGHDTCRGLSPAGRAQAEALRDRLVASGELGTVDAIYTSILPRTIETAAILAPALGDAPTVAECEWCEIHAGEAEGMLWSDLRDRYPQTGAPFDPFRSIAPDAESWHQFFERAGARLQRVAVDHRGETVVVVCHGGIVGASFLALADLPVRMGVALVHEAVNTSLTEWRFTDDEWRLVRYNDAAHAN